VTVTDPTTERLATRQQSALTAHPRIGAVLHHGATTDEQWIIDVETTGRKQVSSNRVVKNTRCVEVADDNMRAWSLSDAYWDSVLHSVETANESTNGWTISDSSHETLARMVAYWASVEGWWPHRDGDPKSWTVIGHREVYTIHGGSYATACPGGMDLDRVTRRAQQLLQTSGLAGRGVTIIMSFDEELKGSDGGSASAGQWLVEAGERVKRLWEILSPATIWQNHSIKASGAAKNDPGASPEVWLRDAGQNALAVRQQLVGAPGEPTIRDLVKQFGAPTVTVKADAAVFVEALQDPAVAKALAPAFATAVADEIDRRNNVKR
jgi:hypothetical protein